MPLYGFWDYVRIVGVSFGILFLAVAGIVITGNAANPEELFWAQVIFGVISIGCTLFSRKKIQGVI